MSRGLLSRQIRTNCQANHDTQHAQSYSFSWLANSPTGLNNARLHGKITEEFKGFLLSLRFVNSLYFLVYMDYLIKIGINNEFIHIG